MNLQEAVETLDKFYGWPGGSACHTAWQIIRNHLEEAAIVGQRGANKNMIYLIEKAWSDSMENDVNSAFGYAPFAYVESEAEAKDICEKSRLLDERFCWAVSEPVQEKQYRPIPKYAPRKRRRRTAGCGHSEG